MTFFKRHPALSIFGLALCTISAFLVFVISSYEYEVKQGAFGPLSIGDSKEHVYDTILGAGEGPIHPRRMDRWRNADGKISEEQLLQLSPAVWVSAGFDLSAHVEFENDRIARFQFVYPKRVCGGCSAKVRAEQQVYNDELKLLEMQTFIGQSRKEFYDHVNERSFMDGRRILSKIVELEYNTDFHTPHWKRKIDYNGDAYRAHVLRNDRWYVSGFEELVWYRWFDTPFISSVMLQFEDDKLIWVRHYHAPNELP